MWVGLVFLECVFEVLFYLVDGVGECLFPELGEVGIAGAAFGFPFSSEVTVFDLVDGFF